MAKFNTYGYKAENQDGKLVAEGMVLALSHESAWMKAVAHSFDAITPNTGDTLGSMEVWRQHNPSESHG